ncbi:Uncharacterised protein [Mycobacterium tuberculosis]|uniref:Uncharacterized protein n=1 Tax=Mycobacterium tuberculosis TaxID=1773 RepID=A0A0T9YST5_MYCTX|nr:Uncharacterised protein [Mycobacterium tuberculosis]CFH30444.1 Uncharacterised protein [Mycobacterium tuberculosis]CFS06438.1 Uncharacterised protein [Mycobacterium tuberculosis]CFS38733.1 Uncharacterised protein [Mycobacterium tuberculosis]CKM80957.1 Uncharacterised protein [Mycobacterium tuberculosis]
MLAGLRKVSGLPSEGSHGSNPENIACKKGRLVSQLMNGCITLL